MTAPTHPRWLAVADSTSTVTDVAVSEGDGVDGEVSDGWRIPRMMRYAARLTSHAKAGTAVAAIGRLTPNMGARFMTPSVLFSVKSGYEAITETGTFTNALDHLPMILLMTAFPSVAEDTPLRGIFVRTFEVHEILVSISSATDNQ